MLRAGLAARTAGPVPLALALIVVSTLPLGAAGCAPMSPQRARPDFDLSKCETLEPGLFRCNGFDAPLCNSDFSRADVGCFKISADGNLVAGQFDN
jgi:hypothetical protein